MEESMVLLVAELLSCLQQMPAPWPLGCIVVVSIGFLRQTGPFCALADLELTVLCRLALTHHGLLSPLSSCGSLHQLPDKLQHEVRGAH